MIFQGIRTSIAKESFSFVIRQGVGGAGADPLSPFPPLDPHMHIMVHFYFVFRCIKVRHQYTGCL